MNVRYFPSDSLSKMLNFRPNFLFVLYLGSCTMYSITTGGSSPLRDKVSMRIARLQGKWAFGETRKPLGLVSTDLQGS